MSLEFQFETFVDVYHSIFSEYLSSVIAKLPKENEKYRAMKEELLELYDKYPKILDIFDMDKAERLSAEECAGLVKALQLRNELTDMELQSVYFRGCYDGVGYLKKAGIAYESLNQYSDAVKAYTTIKEKYYNSLEASDIDKYISRASAQVK